jgi:hypothetical protein
VFPVLIFTIEKGICSGRLFDRLRNPFLIYGNILKLLFGEVVGFWEA